MFFFRSVVTFNPASRQSEKTVIYHIIVGNINFFDVLLT